MKIILLGPPGAGKSTVAETLEEEFNLFHLSIGRYLRDEVKRKTLIGRKIKSYIDKGDLVPRHFVNEIARLVLGRKRKYILDGFPRDLHQAQDVEDLNVELVLYLDVPLAKVVERLSGRRVCPKDGKSYHIKYLKPKKKGVCDCDGKTKLIRRKDDSIKAIKERFKVYQEETRPLIAYYKKKGILVKVSAVPLPTTVCKNVIKAVKKWFQ